MNMTKFSKLDFEAAPGYDQMRRDKAFAKQVEPKIGLTVEKHTEAKDETFSKEQELFYRATDYRG